MIFGSGGFILLGIEHDIALNRSSHVWGGKIEPSKTGMWILTITRICVERENWPLRKRVYDF